MKNKIGRNDFIDAMSDVDPKYIRETAPEGEKAGRTGTKVKILRIVLPAAALIAAAAVTLGVIAANRKNGQDVPPAEEPSAKTSTVTENQTPSDTQTPAGAHTTSESSTPADTSTEPSTPTEDESRVVLDGMTFYYDAEKRSYTLIELDQTGQEEYVIPDEINGCPVTKIGKLQTDGIRARLVVSRYVEEIPDEVLRFFAKFGLSVDEENPRFAYTTGCVINKEKKELLFGFAGCVIPRDGSVTKIADSAFAWAEDLESIVIPDGVIEIGTEAFVGCRSLKRVEICDSVTRYHERIFVNCVSLQTVRLSANAGVIEKGMFTGCSSLREIELPEGVKTIENDAFWNCTALTDVYLPRSLETVKEDVFNGCSAGVSAHYPGGVAAWCAIDFFGAWSLPYHRGGDLYLDGTRLVDLVIPKTLRSVPGARFFGCNIESVTIEEGIDTIEYSAFAYCAQLSRVELPLTLTTVGEGAFSACPALEKIGYAGTVSDWEKVNVHENNDLLYEKVIVCTDGEVLPGIRPTFDEGYASYRLNDDKTGYILTSFRDELGIKEALIPQSVNKLPVVGVDDGAFMYCAMLTRIELPEGVRTIGSQAFEFCENLSYISLPAGLERIGENAFAYDIALTDVAYGGTVDAFRAAGFDKNGNDVLLTVKITCADGVITPGDGPEKSVRLGELLFILDDGKSYYTLKSAEGLADRTCEVPKEVGGLPVRFIGEKAFCGAPNLQSVTLPETLAGIGDQAFASCRELREILFEGGCPELEYIGSSAFSSCSWLVAPTFPDALLDIGAYAFEGCTSFGVFKVPAGMRTVGEHAFENCSGLTAIDFSGSAVTTIGQSAFANCRALTRADIPVGVTSVGAGAFESCTALTAVSFENARTLIGHSAFADCAALADVRLPAEATVIAESAFSICTSLTRIELPETLTEISAGAFRNCSALTAITIPDGVDFIGAKAFENCKALKKATLPGGYLKVDIQAFKNCTALEELTMPSYLQISNSAFSGCTSIKKVITNSPDFWNMSAFASSKEFKNAEIVFTDGENLGGE